ncbi:FAD-binding oxidoreductase [Metabacillus sp. RGM 3146]|uniref:FAD-binding oxidoreductase n=1 Tax=Metabacillus sp. RGM 3146 TaxID=3401092 RepID=UPI003B9A988E
MNLVKEMTMLLSEDQVSINRTILEQHSKDESYHRPASPDIVVFPKTAEEVSKILSFAYENEIPVVPFGLGTSLEGHAIPYSGGISIDFQLMNQVLEVSPDDFLVRVQPGITRSQLNKELKKHGLFFTVDPGADATIGGMAATNASGTTSVRYGIMRDQVREMEVVLADGRIIRAGSKSAKSSSGLHLPGLFVGSEGTLGVFTELTLRVYGIPEAIIAGRAIFPSLEKAVQTVFDILSAGIPVARIELLDEFSVNQFNKFNHAEFEEKPTLFMEFHGNKEGIQYDVDFAGTLALDNDCFEFLFEKETKKRNELWEARHNLAYAFVHHSPGKKLMVTDVCVPLSKLAEAILDARKEIDLSGLSAAILGHVGDGNYHVILTVDHSDAEEMDRAEKLNAKLVDRALELGGTCTGEHGVGVGKAKYQRKEHGAAYEVMKALKKTLDEKNILNPGKIFAD